MIYGCYASLDEVKDMLGISGTTDDTVIRKMLEAMSRAIDQYCNRTFQAYTETKIFDGANVLWIPDLLSITTLKTDEDGDYDYDNTFTTSDYILYGVGLEDTLNTFPKVRIEIDSNGDYSSFAAGYKKGVQIAGLWGYGDGISATPYTVDTTLSAAISTTTATTYTVTSATNISAGQVHLIDSEQTYVESVSSTTVTCKRGVNGTTAATHSNSTSIYIYDYPADVKQACMNIGGMSYQNKSKYGLKSEQIGDYSYTTASSTVSGGTGIPKGTIESLLDDMIRPYRRIRV